MHFGDILRMLLSVLVVRAVSYLSFNLHGARPVFLLVLGRRLANSICTVGSVTSIRWVLVRNSSSESQMCKLPFLKSAWRNASLLARAGKPKGHTAYAPLVLVTRFRRPASKMRPPALRMTLRMCFCSQHQRLCLSLQVTQSFSPATDASPCRYIGRVFLEKAKPRSRLRLTNNYTQLRLGILQQYQREGGLLLPLSGTDQMSEPEKDQHGHNDYTQ